MDVTYTVDPGPKVLLGHVTFRGLDQVRTAPALRRVPWDPGRTVYSPARLDDLREDLAKLDVFSSIRVRLADEPGPGGVTPVLVDVREQDRHFIAIELNYETSQGFGSKASWGDRNLLGGAERLELTASVGGIGRRTTAIHRIDYSVGARYFEPDFLARNLNLVVTATLLNEQPDPYARKAALASAALEYHPSKRLTFGAGAAFEQSHVRERSGRVRDTTLFGLPLSITWDGSNSLLNPTRGVRVSATATPYLAAFGAAEHFTILRGTASGYLPLMGDDRLVWAGRGSIGSILGDSTFEIPADKRFYAGGGGSVRGYGYQTIGPRDATGQPRGGRSLVEFSTELRVRVTDAIGIVPFVDGGNVWNAAYPKLGSGLKWGAGLGARYHTPIGPLRFDVAVPLNRHPGSSTVQFYISLGQAY
jgi:translocation and assembly module TamA